MCDSYIQPNSNTNVEAALEIHGMVDAHAHHNSLATWPLPLLHKWFEGKEGDGSKESMEANIKEVLPSGTKEKGGLLIELNTSMYKHINSDTCKGYKELFRIRKEKDHLLYNGGNERKPPNSYSRKFLRNRRWSREDLEKWEMLDNDEEQFLENMQNEALPSLVITPTMDMEFAHIDGYDGKPIYQQRGNKVFYKKRTPENKDGEEIELDQDETLMFQNWELQVNDTEAAAKTNPMRLFPLFSYDPRRYMSGDSRWSDPFAYILGHTHSVTGIKESSRIWLGFEMNPLLGFRPLDELCVNLLLFYKECQKEENKPPTPILVHCAPEGIITHDGESYEEFDKIQNTTNNRNNGRDQWMEWITRENSNNVYMFHGSDIYAGQEIITSSLSMNHFYNNYGHPQNWRYVLEAFPRSHLCFAGFGGNSEWKHDSMKEWANSSWANTWLLPPRELIRSMIILACKYPNVYIDISGLDIFGHDNHIREGLERLLPVLKHKLIFGSNWYLTYLTGIPKENARYDKYCNEFKELFSGIDGTGELWERISLINPWRCFALTESKIEAMSRVLGEKESDDCQIKKVKNKLIEVNSYISEKMSEFGYNASNEAILTGDYFDFARVKTIDGIPGNASEQIRGHNKFNDELYFSTLRKLRNIKANSLNDAAKQGFEAINEISKYYFCEFCIAIDKEIGGFFYFDTRTLVCGSDKSVENLFTEKTVASIHTHVLNQDFYFSGSDYLSSFLSKEPLYLKHVYDDEKFWRTDPLSKNTLNRNRPYRFFSEFDSEWNDFYRSRHSLYSTIQDELRQSEQNPDIFNTDEKKYTNAGYKYLLDVVFNKKGNERQLTRMIPIK
ncbi:MAG: amidohydrolase [Oscillospiraceae bacterium]|jgi:hypothetical protein|nr:amidohydrolase [Oscillospiraceae bacterium]